MAKIGMMYKENNRKYEWSLVNTVIDCKWKISTH